MAAFFGAFQLDRIFLGDHRIFRKAFGQGAADERLAAEVGHGDRALVLLGQHLR